MNKKYYLILFALLSSLAWKDPAPKVEVMVLGTVQDAGSPHMACDKACCKDLFDDPDPSRMVSSLGIIDHPNNKSYIIDASPDLARQTKLLNSSFDENKRLPDAIFLTHAHIGHYSGLMYVGREGANAHGLPVYCGPGMQNFLKTNGPWDQLIRLKNIRLENIDPDNAIELGDLLGISVMQVPHRDEYSETFAYRIDGPNKKVLFIPDIDKWQNWDKNILEEIKAVDLAFLDATFFDKREIPGRDISEIPPHPFISESMELFKELSAQDKAKVHFIHMNHSNPALDKNSKAYKKIIASGFKVAYSGQRIGI